MTVEVYLRETLAPQAGSAAEKCFVVVESVLITVKREVWDEAHLATRVGNVAEIFIAEAM